MVWRAFSPIPLRSRSTSSRQSARASAYWPAAARASASWNFKFEVVGIGGQGCAGGLDAAAGLLGLEAQRQLGLDLLGLGLEKPAPLQARESAPVRPRAAPARARSAPARSGPPVRSGSSARAALYFASAAFGSDRSNCARLGGERLGRRGQEPVDPGPDHRLGLDADKAVDRLAVANAEDRRNRPHAKLSGQLGLACRYRPWPAETCRRTPAPAFPAPGPACGTDRTTWPRSRSPPARNATARSRPAESSAPSPRSQTRTSLSCRSSVKYSSWSP